MKKTTNSKNLNKSDMKYQNTHRHQNKYHIPYAPSVGSQEGTIPARTEQKWEGRKSTETARLFSKRLQKDLEELEAHNLPTCNFWDGQGLFLYGSAGAGKTVLSAQLLLDVRKHLWLNGQNKTVGFVSVPSLFARLKRSFDTKDENQYEILDELNNTWLLVLDDLGMSGTPSNWLLETLYVIINHRYENLLPTIFTSNLNLNDLSELYGDVRITSRIDRMCIVAHKAHWSSK